MKLYGLVYSFGFAGFAFVATEKGREYVKSIAGSTCTEIEEIGEIINRKQAREIADKWENDHAIIRGDNAKINWR